MRFLADEHVSRRLVELLRAAGHDVRRSSELGHGLADEALLKMALSDGRVVLTEDYDFGRLVFGLGHRSHGVVIVAMAQFPGNPAERAVAIAARLDTLGGDMVGHLTVLAPDGIRRKRL